MSNGILVAATSSGAGKSTIVTGLCRAFARKGVTVAPFQALSMSNDAVAADDGGEIARSQFEQARAAGTAPVTAMNPVLVKPINETRSKLFVRGRPAPRATDKRAAALDAYRELADAFDVVIAEGAGSAAEVTMLDSDIANLRLAHELGLPAILVADFDRGGAVAAVVGAVQLLPDELRECLRGIVINRFRGDREQLAPTLELMTECTELPVLGVVEWLDLEHVEPALRDGAIDVAVVQFPHAPNFDDVDPLRRDPAVSVRSVATAAALGDPDLVIVPGSRAVLADLDWLRETGLALAIERSSARVFGIGGGYQMMGERIVDVDGIERRGDEAGLGWLPVVTRYGDEKVVRRRYGTALDENVSGFEVRNGTPRRVGRAGAPFITVADGSVEGSVGDRFTGTSWHGLFESDGFRRSLLAGIARERGRPVQLGTTSYADAVGALHDRLADAVEAALGTETLESLVTAGAGAKIGATSPGARPRR